MQAGEQQGRDHDHAEEVAQPPHPERPQEQAAGQVPEQIQAGNADQRAQRATQRRSDQGELADTADVIQRGAEWLQVSRHEADEPGPGGGTERDAQRRLDRHGLDDECHERTDEDADDTREPEAQARSGADTCRQPDRGDDVGDVTREIQAEARRRRVKQGGRGDDEKEMPDSQPAG